MDDRDQIAALIHSYAERLDAGDLDGVAALFTHATVRTDGGQTVRRGAPEVRRMYDAVVLYGDTPRTRHLISNLDIRIAATTATSSCSVTVMQSVEHGSIATILVGRYIDAFERNEHGWHFSDRLIHVDLMGDLSRHYR